MHPFLKSRKSLGLYFLIWIDLSIVPATLLGPLDVVSILASSLCCLLFAVFALPTWYLCKANPIGPTSFYKTTAVHVFTMALSAIVFRLSFGLVAELAAVLPAQQDLPSRIAALHQPLLAVGALFYALVVMLQYVLLEMEVRRVASEQEGSLLLAAKQAQLQALRAQVHPHFLFNSLNTVSAMISYDPDSARKACVLLGEYLRATLGAQEHAMVTVQEEWDLSEKYLTVEALRLGDRLLIETDFDPAALDCKVPSLLLQPLVENAITHGVALAEEPAPLRVTARLMGERLLLGIKNGHTRSAKKGRRGMGIENVRARLFAHYQKEASLRIERDGAYFAVMLELPVQKSTSLSTSEATS